MSQSLFAKSQKRGMLGLQGQELREWTMSNHQTNYLWKAKNHVDGADEQYKVVITSRGCPFVCLLSYDLVFVRRSTVIL